MEHDSLIIKAVLIGNSGVGKTSLSMRFCDNMFSDSVPKTIGIDFKVRTLRQGGCTRMLQIWDTAGNPQFRTITKSYYKGGKIFVFVYSITDAESFQATEKYIEDVNQASPEGKVFILAGNKLDQRADRKVTREDGEQLALKHNMKFIEVCAKEDTDLEEKCLKLLSE